MRFFALAALVAALFAPAAVAPAAVAAFQPSDACCVVPGEYPFHPGVWPPPPPVLIDCDATPEAC